MPFLPILFACTDAEEDGDDVSEVSAYEMPDRSGCTYETAFDREYDGSVDYTTWYEFDEHDAVGHHEQIDLEAGTTYEITYERDENGCIVGSEVVDEGPDGTTGMTLTQTCDAHGNPESTVFVFRADGVEQGAVAYEYVNTYDGDELVDVTGEASYDGESMYAFAYRYTWSDGRISHIEYDLDGELRTTTDQTWHDDEQLATWHQEQADGSEVADETWEVDEHGRVETQTYVYDGEDGDGAPLAYRHRDEKSWYDGIYQVSLLGRDWGDDGTLDGEWAFDCSDAWPWSCDVTIDGTDDDPAEQPEDPYDGEIDHGYSLAWSCP